MKDALFNPIPIPDLNLQSTEPIVAKSASKKPTRRKAASGKATCRTSRIRTTRRVLDPKASAIRFARKVSRKAKTSWKRIKGGLHARLSHLDREQLKEVLLACGLAVVTVVAILTLVKLTPVVIAILAAVGLGAVIQMWDRVRVMRMPS